MKPFEGIYIMVGENFRYSLDCVKVIQGKKLPIVAIGGESSTRIVGELGLLSNYPQLIITNEVAPWNNVDFLVSTNNPLLLGISCGLSKIMPKDFLQNRFCINTHPSALPFNRGSHQSFWAIMESTLGGGTLHIVNHKIDVGDIIAQETFELDAKITSQELQSKQLEICINLLKSHLLEIYSGKFPRKIQVGGTYHNKSEILKATTLLDSESIKIADLLRLCRATCNSNNGFWIETKTGNFHISINSVTFLKNTLGN